MSRGFVTTLLDWFDEHGRDLPWRHTRDPYAIWLSEVILQQTRIVQGMDYWHRFMQTWPTVEALAAASEDEVLKMWQGLGYYSRARNLHAAAQQIVALGKFPDTYDEIRKLKGVGDYTAAAIASFAFHQTVATVDGNVYRVLARLQGIDTPINTTQGKKLFASLADSLIPSEFEGVEVADDTWARMNQAMMDFGAIQCTPKSPLCGQCPFMESCEAYRSQQIDSLPVKLKTTKVKERHLTYYYIRYQGKVALHQRGAGDIWQGLWEPYLAEEGQQFSQKGMQTTLVKDFKHVLTHRILYADLILFEPEEQPELPSDYIWVPESEVRSYAVPRLVEIFLTHV